MKTTYKGACHCGRIKFKATIDPAECYVCDCSICKRKGSIMNRTAPEEFELLTDENLLSVYQFNTQIAKHYFCGHCGIHTFHRPRSAPDVWSINVRCLERLDMSKIAPQQVYGSELD